MPRITVLKEICLRVFNSMSWKGWTGVSAIAGVVLLVLILADGGDPMNGPSETAISETRVANLTERGINAHESRCYAEALNYFQQALVIVEQTGDRLEQGNILNNIGTVYQAQGLYDLSLAYLNAPSPSFVSLGTGGRRQA